MRYARSSGRNASASGAYDSCFPRPPRITCSRSSGKDASARSAAATFVAFESFTKRTPPISRTSSMRCGTPSNVASASAIASSSIPAARAAAVAAAAFSRLCGPGMRGSAGSGSSAANSTRVALAGYGAEPARHDRGVRRRSVARRSGACVRVALERAVPVEVVGLEVEENGDRAASSVSTSSSWNDESSQTTHASGGAEPTSDVSGRPTFPATSTGLPAARNTAPRSSVVVVLPFVPVTPRIGFGRSRAPSSISLQTGTPRVRARSHEHRLTRDSRALHDEIDPL